MIAVIENSQWVRKTHGGIRAEHPRVSFPDTLMDVGATWNVDGTDYEAKVIIEVAKPAANVGFKVDSICKECCKKNNICNHEKMDKGSFMMC